MPATQGASHVALTVRDMEASAQWYRRVLGWREIARFDATEAGSPRIILFDPGSGFALGLCQWAETLEDSFNPRRTGLDHLALRVAEAADLEAWTRHLDHLGVSHSPVRETPLGVFVSFEDPDGIQLELWLDAGS